MTRPVPATREGDAEEPARDHVGDLLGEVGGAGQANLAEQIPYLISGGLFGIALVVTGTGLVMRYSLARLFRFWLARLVAEHSQQTDRTVDALGRIETALDGSSVTGR